jgi:hypothetical protein
MILNWRLVVLLKGLMAILPEPPGWNTKLYPMCLQIGTKEHEKLSTCIGVALLLRKSRFFLAAVVVDHPQLDRFAGAGKCNL